MTEARIPSNSWLLITNPTAGKRKLSEQTKYVTEALNKKGILCTFEKTAYSGHAIELARSYAEQGFLNFIVLGGDGTLSEVVNGLLSSKVEDTSKLKVALIPRGTGNDWGRFWNLRKNDAENMKIFFQGKTKLIDTGEIHFHDGKDVKKHYFINSVGFGLDAHVANMTNRLKKVLGGFSFLYTISFLFALTKYKTYRLKIELDGKEESTPLITMNIANGPYCGGGIRQNPSAIPYDGIFDMNIVSKITLKDAIQIIPNLYNGKINRSKVIKPYRAKKIKIETSSKALVEADGIIVPHAHKCEIQILPNSLQMIVP